MGPEEMLRKGDWTNHPSDTSSDLPASNRISRRERRKANFCFIWYKHTHEKNQTAMALGIVQVLVAWNLGTAREFHPGIG
jgi:hypothetical protein